MCGRETPHSMLFFGGPVIVRTDSPVTVRRERHVQGLRAWKLSRAHCGLCLLCFETDLRPSGCVRDRGFCASALRIAARRDRKHTSPCLSRRQALTATCLTGDGYTDRPYRCASRAVDEEGMSYSRRLDHTTWAMRIFSVNERRA